MGNSWGEIWKPFFTSVHPHVHGELLFCAFSPCLTIGSSPRAWGTHNHPQIWLMRVRFIPTCMGNSDFSGTSLNNATVHPHVHGELSVNGIIPDLVRGSSPRAWGTLSHRQFYLIDRRFIPTCMGNSYTNGILAAIPAVHPHVHGELKSVSPLKPECLGSSPRAWGTPGRLGAHDPEEGFIPTCMGNSRGWRTGLPSRSVHPHVHGELHRRDRWPAMSGGSSPRAWGTRS